MTNKIHNDHLPRMINNLPAPDDTEADVLNDETFGDCDLDAIKIKSDFGENGEFLGENIPQGLPDFFDSDLPDTGGDLEEGFALLDPNDQSQQPSIDALLGEDPIRIPSGSIHLRSSSSNPLFSMAISQARENPFAQPSQIPRASPMMLPAGPPPPPQSMAPPQQINYQVLKQLEQMLISRQIPPQERAAYMQAMIDKMQREAINLQQQRMMNLNVNGHDRYRENNLHRPMAPFAQQREGPRPMGIGDLLERARNINPMTNSRSESPGMGNPGMSSQFMDAIQRSDQIPIADNQTKQIPVSSSPMETMGSPSTSSHHPSNQSRHNRQAKHYPRPPCLNTWQGRGPGHDEFAGMMNDREKQWVVKIQLHQVSQSKEEDFYFQKWSHQKRGQMNNQSKRHDRGQYISYPVLQLLKSIQQEKELADRLSQSSAQVSYSNVNPAQNLPYALPLQSQLGKQSVATPRHPRCTLHLDGHFAMGKHVDAITHEKYDLGLLLHIENLHRDLARLEDEDENNKLPGDFLQSVIDRYLNDSKFLFADMFGQHRKGQWILERLCAYLMKNSTTPNSHLELILVRLYGSLSYIVQRWSSTFQIEAMIMNIISSMQQYINIKSENFEQLLSQVYLYFNEQIKTKMNEFKLVPSSSPFSDPALFSNAYTGTILIELLLTLERRCYSLPNSSQLPLQIIQQLQPQLQYQLSDSIRSLVTEICQALIACTSAKKILKPFLQVQQAQFGLILKFLRVQTSGQVFALLEPKLISTCIKSN